MDADFSHEPEALPSLIAPLAEGIDLAVGSRYVPGGSIPNWRWHRRLLSQGGNIYAAMLLRLHVTDSTSGFRAYRAEALRGSTSTRCGPKATASRSRWSTRCSSTAAW